MVCLFRHVVTGAESVRKIQNQENMKLKITDENKDNPNDQKVSNSMAPTSAMSATR